MFTHPLPPDAELRLLELRHAEELFTVIDANRQHLRPWFGWVDSSTQVEHTRSFLAAMLADFTGGRGFSAGIWQRDSTGKFRLVGSVGFHGYEANNRKIEMGYWLVATAQGGGLMTRAARAMLDHAFTHMDIHRVKIMAAPENVRSAGICRRLGLREEGLHKEASWTGAGWRDLISFAILKHEWEQRA